MANYHILAAKVILTIVYVSQASGKQKMAEKNKILLFDFDGTITKQDTLIEIAKFSTSYTSFLMKFVLLIPSMIFMKLRLISNQKGKEIFLKQYFGSSSEDSFNKICTDFSNNHVPKLIRPLALKKIKEEVENGNAVYIVSASPENWIKPWAEKHTLQVISTKLKFENDRLSGIEGINCNGEEKVRRIREEINLDGYSKVIAFGDTEGDLPMLALAEESHYKPFQ